MKKKILLFMMAVYLGGTFAGCADNESGKGGNTGNEAQLDVNTIGSDNGNGSNNEGADAIDHADLFGTVIEFSDTGCILGKGNATEDTKMIMADGESAGDVSQITVIYGENTEFQIALTSATDITLESGSKEDVKKSSVIYVYGINQEGGTFLADMVIVERYQG